MRVAETFAVGRPPEVVFDYLTNPSNLAEWQTSKTSVEQLTDGPPRLGTRVRERTRGPGGREFEQVVEFSEFERPRRVRAHVVDGPYPIDGTWVLRATRRRDSSQLYGGGRAAERDANHGANREARDRSPVRRLPPKPPRQSRGWLAPHSEGPLTVIRARSMCDSAAISPNVPFREARKPIVVAWLAGRVVDTR